MTETDSEAGIDGWAILELMGHRRLGGRVSEATIAGGAFIRIDVPHPNEAGIFTASQFYSPSAVYAITPTTAARADVIFVFPYGRKVHILNIDTDCKDWLVTAEHGEFLAVGSGSQLAQALFRLHLSGTRTLEEGKVIAHRILDDAIEIAAYGLGHPIHVWAITANGEVQKLDNNQLDALKQSSELWRQLEREALASALSPPARLEEIPTFPAQQE